MPFELKSNALDSGITVLALSGTMTMGNQLQNLEWTVDDLTKRQQNRIVLDLSGITYLDSSAIGVLVGCHSTVRNAGGEMRVAGVTSRVETILKMTGVNTVLTLDPTREASVAAFAGKS